MAHILYFGRLEDVLGLKSEQRDLPGEMTSTTALRTWLDECHNAGGALLEASVRVAINNQIVADPAPVSNTDEIAFMPPVGGG